MIDDVSGGLSPRSAAPGYVSPHDDVVFTVGFYLNYIRPEKHGSRGDRRGSFRTRVPSRRAREGFASPVARDAGCEEGSSSEQPALVGRSPTIFQGAGPLLLFDDDEAPSTRGGSCKTRRAGRGPIGRDHLSPRLVSSGAPLDNDDGRRHDTGGSFALGQSGRGGTGPERIPGGGGRAILRPGLRRTSSADSADEVRRRAESPLRAPRVGTRTINNVRSVTSTSSLEHLGIEIDPPTMVSSCNTAFGFFSQSLMSEIPGAGTSSSGSPVGQRSGARAVTRGWDEKRPSESRMVRRRSSSSSDGFFYTEEGSSPPDVGRDPEAAGGARDWSSRSPPNPRLLEFLRSARVEQKCCPRVTTRRGASHTPWQSGCSFSSLERYHATSFEAGSFVRKRRSSSRTGGGSQDHGNAAEHGQHHCAGVRGTRHRRPR